MRKVFKFPRVDLTYFKLFALLVVLILFAGCNKPRTENQVMELFPEESGELGEPGELEEPGEPIIIVEDTRSDGENSNWMAQYIVGGIWADTWFANQYERPFTAYEMVYQPHLDIQEARIRPAGDRTVFEIQAVAPPSGQRVYISLEIDTDLDNRPDLLFLTRAVEDTAWDDQMITVLVDANRDVGGNRPRLAEPHEDSWNGFEDFYVADGSIAFVRRSPDSDSVYQIAIFNELFVGDQFVWRVWLEGEIFQPGWVEYNDRISLQEAGSPYLYSPNYPLKNLASLDNTCLHFYGGETNQPQAGFCGTMIELTGHETVPPDDQFVNPGGENPVSIIFPNWDPGDGDESPDPTIVVFDPGYFFQPTPTPYPNFQQFPTLAFEVPETQEGPYIAAVATPSLINAVAATPETLYSEPAPTAETAYGVPVPTLLIIIPGTEMFDPYAGSTPPPTEMFDPYQGSSPTPTPVPLILFPTNTPTLMDMPVIILKTATPTAKPIIFLKPATPTP